MRINYSNFKNFIIVSLLLVSCIINAQTECKTIAEIRTQASGSSVKYVGSATTTFYGPGGILIEDTTGYLYVKNTLLGEYGTSKIRTNMQISNITGTFNTATDMEMSHIEMSTRQVNAIKLENEEASFDITDVTLNELLSNPMNYECRPIRLTDIKVINNGYSYSIGNENNTINLVAGWDVQIPARGTFEGYYGNNGTQGFIIPSAQNVTATAYNAILDIKNAYEIESPNDLGIEDAMLVNHITKNADGSAYIYAQQTDVYQTTTGIVLHINNYNKNINVGDSICGVKGKFTHFTLNDNNKIIGSKIAISANDAESIVVVNSNNELNATLIDDLEYVIGYGAINYESLFVISPKGKIKQRKINDTDKYTLEINGKYIVLEGVDCSKFVDESVAVMGILDAGFINQGETSIILRSENDILATTYTFNTLEEMKAAGQPLATGVTYVLDNNVLVTHVHSWIIKDLDLTIYGMFVQDETGGLYIQTQSKINFVAGDSIKGISGTYHAYENEAPYLDLKSVTNINKLSSDNLNSIEYEEVTMEDLSINPEKYASQVVKLMGVGHGSRQINNQGTMENQKFLYQGQDTMVYEIWDYTLYEYNNIVGVFDYGSYRSFSIIPLSQNHIEKGKYIGTDIENNQVINTISIQEDNLFAPNAIAINIYDINGKILKSAHNDNINISNLNHGIYIIKVTYNNNLIYTSKIIK
jgi:hypothetical protein